MTQGELRESQQRIEAALAALLEAIAKMQAAVDELQKKPGHSSDGVPTVFPPYGQSAGKPIHGASENDLNFYARGAQKNLDDQAKSKWHGRAHALLEAIGAERANR